MTDKICSCRKNYEDKSFCDSPIRKKAYSKSDLNNFSDYFYCISSNYKKCIWHPPKKDILYLIKEIEHILFNNF